MGKWQCVECSACCIVEAEAKSPPPCPYTNSIIMCKWDNVEQTFDQAPTTPQPKPDEKPGEDCTLYIPDTYGKGNGKCAKRLWWCEEIIKRGECPKGFKYPCPIKRGKPKGCSECQWFEGCGADDKEEVKA